MHSGNRNNQLIKYGFMLIDSGYQLADTRLKLDALNGKLDIPLSADEIEHTIWKSVQKKYFQNGGT